MGKRYVKIGTESEFGGGATTSGVYATTVSNSPDRNVIYEETVDNWTAREGYGGGLKLSGTLEGNLRPLQYDPVLEALMGGASTGVYYTTYTLDEVGSMEIDVGYSNAGGSVEHDYVGVGVKSAKISCESGDFAKISADWIAKDVTDGTYSEPSYTSEEPIVFWGVDVAFGGTSSTEVKSMELEINRNLVEDYFTLGTFKLKRLTYSGATEINGTLTMTEHEFDEIARLMYGSTGGTSVPATNTLGEASITATFTYPDGSEAMVLTSPVSLYTDTSMDISSMEEFEKAINFRALDGTSPFKIEVPV